MLNIISSEIKKDFLETEKDSYLFTIQLELEEGDPALVEGGTELKLLYDNYSGEIDSYAFTPKNNPYNPTISVSLRDEEYEYLQNYCKEELKKDA